MGKKMKRRKKMEREKEKESIGSSCRWCRRAGVGGKDGYPCLHCVVCGLAEWSSLSTYRLGELRSLSQKSSRGNMGEGVSSRGAWWGLRLRMMMMKSVCNAHEKKMAEEMNGVVYVE
jgi:hypothetical protein